MIGDTPGKGLRTLPQELWRRTSQNQKPGRLPGSICEYAKRRKQLGTPLDLVQDHGSLQVAECQLRIFQAREILRALEVEDGGRAFLLLNKGAGQSCLSHLARAQYGNNRVPRKQMPDDLMLPLSLYHAQNITMKIGSSSSIFQHKRSHVKLRWTFRW